MGTQLDCRPKIIRGNGRCLSGLPLFGRIRLSGNADSKRNNQKEMKMFPLITVACCYQGVCLPLLWLQIAFFVPIQFPVNPKCLPALAKRIRKQISREQKWKNTFGNEEIKLPFILSLGWRNVRCFSYEEIWFIDYNTLTVWGKGVGYLKDVQGLLGFQAVDRLWNNRFNAFLITRLERVPRRPSVHCFCSKQMKCLTSFTFMQSFNCTEQI